MRILGNKILITRGEQFSLDFDIRDKEGAPYVPLVDPQTAKSYVQITVSSALYPQAERYKRRYWINQDNTIKFQSKEIIIKPTSNPTTAYQNVYYEVNDDGSKEYFYWNGTSYVEYDFVIRNDFPSTDTQDWLEQRYLYEIKYIVGNSTHDYLTSLWQACYSDQTPPEADIELYWGVLKKHPCLLKDFNWQAPICNFSRQDILQKPNLIIVQAYA